MIECVADEDIERGHVVHIAWTEPSGRPHIECAREFDPDRPPIGVAARDILKGETVQYEPNGKTGDIHAGGA